MSRSGYIDDLDTLELGRWRGVVASTIRGKRGQGLLREMLTALDNLPEPKLIKDALECDGQVCALGAVGRARGLDMSGLDPEDCEALAGAFGISEPLAREVMYLNDEAGWNDPPTERFKRMRAWVEQHIAKPRQECT